MNKYPHTNKQEFGMKKLSRRAFMGAAATAAAGITILPGNTMAGPGNLSPDKNLTGEGPAAETMRTGRTGSAIEIVDRPNSRSKNKFYLSNQEPLQPSPMVCLPLGAVQAEGWVKHQLELMADGQTGHLEEFSPYLRPNSGWLGGKEEGWEEAAYWLRGFYDLAQLTRNERLRKTADHWIETIISSQKEDGYYGSGHNRLIKGKDGQEVVDVWPQMVMNDVLISHYEATGDKRIIPMMTSFFAFCRDLPQGQFLPKMSWEYYENYAEHFGSWKPRIQVKRAGDFVPQIIWLFNNTGDKWLLDLAIKVYHKTQPAMNEWLDNHTVHFAQRFRYPAQMYPIIGDHRYLKNTWLFYDSWMKTWGQMPRGTYAADERIRAGKIDPRQAIETCSLVELNKSHYILGRITGDTTYADRVEDITFNHLPASHAPDHKSLRYLTASNMVYSVPKMDFKNQGIHPLFAADLHRCCMHNSGMGWPWFVRNLWQVSPDNGLIAWLYGPNTVTAKVGESGTTVKIACETMYPFGDQITMTLNCDKEVTFPLYFRIPGWCTNIEMKVSGEKQKVKDQGGKLIKVSRKWKNDDQIEVRFDMEVKATTWPRTSAVTIDRGPLSYSVRIKESWQKEQTGPSGWPRWSLSPASAWNFGLAIDPENPDGKITAEIADKLAYQPWSEENSPVTLKVPARMIKDWKATIQNTVDAVREGPVKSDEPICTIEMIPMGCAHLRISVLPVVNDREDARYWEDIPNPDLFMLDRLDK